MIRLPKLATTALTSSVTHFVALPSHQLFRRWQKVRNDSEHHRLLGVFNALLHNGSFSSSHSNRSRAITGQNNAADGFLPLIIAMCYARLLILLIILQAGVYKTNIFSVRFCGRSSVVERHVANVNVEGSTPFARLITPSMPDGVFCCLCDVVFTLEKWPLTDGENSSKTEL
jgi:hypothetical protein